MSGEKINEALKAIDKSGLDRPYLNNKFAVSVSEIQEAEIKLGFEFPESYREFLKNLGSGDFHGEEFYGLIPGQLDAEEIPNGLWFTMDMRESCNLPQSVFAFQAFDGDAVACLLLSKMENGECPVVQWDYGEDQEKQLNKPHIIADSFGDYFFDRINDLIKDEV